MLIEAAAFALLVAQVFAVNLALSADNAVVIALASRGLPLARRRRAVVFGAAAAVLLRIVLTITALALLELTYLKLAGGVLLIVIAVKLLVDTRGGAPTVRAGATVAGAVAAILLADLAMSLDNVLAVAAAATGSLAALGAGLALSIPVVVFAATALIKVMARWPVIVTVGAALIGWVAGGLIAREPFVAAALDAVLQGLTWAMPPAGALLVLATAKAAGSVAARQ